MVQWRLCARHFWPIKHHSNTFFFLVFFYHEYFQTRKNTYIKTHKIATYQNRITCVRDPRRNWTFVHIYSENIYIYIRIMKINKLHIKIYPWFPWRSVCPFKSLTERESVRIKYTTRRFYFYFVPQSPFQLNKLRCR